MGYGVDNGIGVRVGTGVDEYAGEWVEVAAIEGADTVWVLLRAGAGTVSVGAALVSVTGLAVGT